MGSVPGICKEGTALVLGAGLEDRAPGNMCQYKVACVQALRSTQC